MRAGLMVCGAADDNFSRLNIYDCEYRRYLLRSMAGKALMQRKLFALAAGETCMLILRLFLRLESEGRTGIEVCNIWAAVFLYVGDYPCVAMNWQGLLAK